MRRDFVCSSVDLVSSGEFQKLLCEETKTWQSSNVCVNCMFFFEIICSCFVSPNFVARELQDGFLFDVSPLGTEP